MTLTDHRPDPLPDVTLDVTGPVRELPAAPAHGTDLRSLTVPTPHGETTIDEVLQRHAACSLVVVHRGQLAHEWYREGMDPLRRHRSYSITKSFTGVLAAIAVHEGVLDREAVVGTIVPELAGTGFGDATVAELADMTVSIGYDEDYDSAGSGPASAAGGPEPFGFGDYMIALGFPPDSGVVPDGSPRSLRDLLCATGPGPRPHGEAFGYATPKTDALAWVLERARGTGYLDLLVDGLWRHLGAEAPARLMLDPSGVPVAGGGLQIATRDLARFGVLLLEQLRDDGPVIPAAVVEAIRAGGDPDVFQRGGEYPFMSGWSYRDQWWLPGDPAQTMSGWGIHGQVLWVDTTNDVVIATHCDGPLPSDDRRDVEQAAMCAAIVDALTRPG
jgi:CubicO group peptidase (beta-lactamase class C family)